MKKNKLLLLIPALALVVAPISTLVSADNDLTLSNDVITNLNNKLSNAVEFRNDITFNYDTPYTSVVVVDQVDNANRSRSVFINKMIVQEQYLKKYKNGKAVEYYIYVSNTVETR